MSRLFLAVAGLLCSTSLSAQGTVVVPDPPLDAARATLRDELLRFRGTLNSIDAAAARLQRDFRKASAASLLSRARVMRDACAESVRGVAPARKAVLAVEGPEKAAQDRKAMIEGLDRLHGTLSRCESEFGEFSQPGKGEEVRGYGNDRATRVQSALRQYEQTLARFFSALGIKVTPLGSETRDLAG